MDDTRDIDQKNFARHDSSFTYTIMVDSVTNFLGHRMSIEHRRRQRFTTMIACRFLFVVFAAVSCLSNGYGQTNGDDSKIKAFMEQLSSPQYKLRETASRELVKVGATAVPYLAEQIVAGSPEAATRSAKILEKIGVSGDEDGVARVARIFLLLSENGYDRFQKTALQLNKRWKRLRVTQTVSQLKKLGVKVDALGSNQIVLGHVDAFGRSIPAPESVAEPTAKAKADDATRLSKSELLEKVAEITNASDTENLTQFSKELAASKPAPVKPSEAQQLEQQIIMEDRLLRVRGGGGVILGGLVTPANDADQAYAIVINDDFTGNDDDLKLISMVPNVHQITVAGRELDEHILNLISTQSALQYLMLQDVKYDLPTMIGFMNRREDVYVSIAGVAFLGVTAQNTTDEDAQLIACQVQSVVPDSAADEAGMEEGDLITKVDGTRIRTFQQLVVAIAHYSPGDEIELEVQRGDETGIFRPTLKHRPADLDQ